MSRFKKPAAAVAPSVDPELAARFAKTNSDTPAVAETPATPTPVAPATPPAAPAQVAEASNRPVKEASYNLGYRSTASRLNRMDNMVAWYPGIKSKQALMDKYIDEGLARDEARRAQIEAQLAQFQG